MISQPPQEGAAESGEKNPQVAQDCVASAAFAT
jgi:hypothetical protein